MKLGSKERKRLLILYLAFLIFVICFCRFKYAYGSDLDWSAQHYAIPDYFRKLFYQTHQLFPSFAPNIGAGENIYYLSYYGLFSPIILISYLLPFVPMSVYIQAVSVIGIMVSAYLFYKWMLKKFEGNTAYFLTVMLMISGSFIFHSHRHIMFVNYMPFLILSLTAVEDYFENKSKWKLILFPFLLTMTSYFFAVSSMAAILIYGIYVYLKKNENESFKLGDFFKNGVCFAGRLLTAVLMSCVLFLPTVYCMLSGRDSGNSVVDMSVLIPSVNLKYLLYHNYSMGLSLFCFCAVLSGIISKKKSRRFLGIIIGLLITFPVFVLILNGGLYTDPKVLIPFVPLCLLLAGQTAEDIFENRFKYKIILPVTAIYFAAGLFICNFQKLFLRSGLADIILLTVFLLIYNKKKIKSAVYISAAGCLAVSTVMINFDDRMVDINDLKAVNTGDISNIAKDISLEKDFRRAANYYQPVHTENIIYNMNYYSSNIYSSLHNKNYNDFYFDEIRNENEFRNHALTTQSRSFLQNFYMSEKYLIAEKTDGVPTGYKLKNSKGDFNLYENDSVLPFGYVSDKIMNINDYKKLEYPYSAEALMNYTISEDKPSTQEFSSNIREIKAFEFNGSEQIKPDENGYEIFCEKEFSQKINLDEKISENEILMISMNVDNNLKGKKSDSGITINGVKNTLTDPNWKYYNGNTSFEFVITTAGQKEIDALNIEFSKGHYKVSDIKCYVMPIPDGSKSSASFECDTKKTQGDIICGKVNSSNGGIFNISIPYSEGFEISVDGKKADPQKVDTAFLGFEIPKGEHEIKIVFTAPLLKAGKIISMFGIILFVILTVYEYKKAGHKRKIFQNT